MALYGRISVRLLVGNRLGQDHLSVVAPVDHAQEVGPIHVLGDHSTAAWLRRF
ncbi:MAG: hypothetical protein KJO60_07655 [Desulfofustis sp.]|nr:hypothetical protein [Desulfofustis sp.]MBT8354382.1 hypothetical protein [Desulfofustis sp.]NNF47058.1 hypothetical protein [Desulfofustis sp.]NNK56571.1 hypothetical protein [Desulfofustis sp.]